MAGTAYTWDTSDKDIGGSLRLARHTADIPIRRRNQRKRCYTQGLRICEADASGPALGPVEQKRLSAARHLTLQRPEESESALPRTPTIHFHMPATVILKRDRGFPILRSCGRFFPGSHQLGRALPRKARPSCFFR